MGGIIFKAAYGDHDREVEISAPSGGGSHYHIYIDRFYYGPIIFIDEQWTITLNPKGNEELTTDDRMILVELVSEANHF